MNTTDRQGYIDAIIKLLEKADPRKLRPVSYTHLTLPTT